VEQVEGSAVTGVDTRLADALRDRYVLLEELGRGGIATVYLAQDLRHERQVALKVLRPELAYQRFVELWRRADPVLQPQVAEVRRRLAEVTGEP
jgi:serine/threonine protein kinase